MKILQVNGLGYVEGGVETELAIMRDILRTDGHTIKTITSDAGSAFEHYSDYEFRVPKSVIGQVISRTFNLRAYKLVRQVCADFDPDIVTFHTLFLPSASVLYASKKRRQVLFVHGPEYYTKWLLRWLVLPGQFKSRPYDMSDLRVSGLAHYAYLRYVLRPIFMRRIKKIKYVLSFSRNTQEMLRTEGLESTYIPNGVKLFGKKSRTGLNYHIGFAGRLTKDKGIEYVIDTFALVAEALPPTKLLIAGRGSDDYVRTLAKKVQALHLSHRIAFLGHLSRQELQDFFDSIDLFLMASSHEAFGMVGVEAMSTGTPVLAPNVGGISEWLRPGQNGDFVPLDDSRVFADTIVHLLQHPEQLRMLGDQAAASVQQFDMVTHVEQIMEFFQKIVTDTK